MKEQKLAQKQFYESQQVEEDENEKNKPAFFRDRKAGQKPREYGQEPSSSDKEFDAHQEKDDGPTSHLSRKAADGKAWKNLQKQLEMDFDPETKSQEELQEFFRLDKENKGQTVDHMNEQIFNYLYERMKERQIRFYAFLNKEFNIMNYKSARCSMHCFDQPEERSVR